MAHTHIEKIVERICDGGMGSEARVIVQLRNVFPGVGGIIRVEQPAVTALRIPHSSHKGMGKELFLLHTILKKLDDFFLRIGTYRFQHITRPLGSMEKSDAEGYLYEWVFGVEAFPWERTDRCGERIPAQLKEWHSFTSSFAAAGIKMSSDVTDSDNGAISKNIIHQLYDYNSININLCWKRIDFGCLSLPIDRDKLKSFLIKNQGELISVLGLNRHELMLFAYRFLYERHEMRRIDQELLNTLSRKYRISSLRHKNAEYVIR